MYTVCANHQKFYNVYTAWMGIYKNFIYFKKRSLLDNVFALSTHHPNMTHQTFRYFSHAPSLCSAHYTKTRPPATTVNLSFGRDGNVKSSFIETQTCINVYESVRVYGMATHDVFCLRGGRLPHYHIIAGN